MVRKLVYRLRIEGKARGVQNDTMGFAMKEVNLSPASGKRAGE